MRQVAGGAGSVPGHAADQTVMRRQNLSLTLQRVRDGGPQSRARLAESTRLNKATVSSLVGELLDRGLLLEADLERPGVGRPAQGYRLGDGVCGIGAELNVGWVAVSALGLDRSVLTERRVRLSGPQAPPEEALDAMAGLVRATVADVSPRHIAGLSVAVPGLVEVSSGRLLHAPNLGWADLPLADLVTDRVGDLGLDLHIENEANLAAMAEASLRPGTRHLVLLTGSVGVGAGILCDGRLLRGAAGYGGEVGHMPIELQGGLCGCGRRGCWETRVGLTALLTGLAEIDDPVLSPGLDTEERLAEVVRRADAGDPRTLNALEQVGTWLGVGAAALAGVLDPEVFVLGGYFSTVARWLEAPMRRELQRRSIGAAGHGYAVEVSALGFHATVRGAAVVALAPVFEDPTLVPRSSTDRMGA